MLSPPFSIPNSAIYTSEGCSSIADASGNLLFYTDGTTVYNSGNQVMPNGTGLNGNFSTTQSALVIKKPGSTSLYYVFTLGANGTGGLDYSIVDMSLSSGTGSVTVKNATLVASGMSEKLTATRHCDGTDIWIITHDNGGSFLAFLLTSAGINTTPVITNYGSVFSGLNYAGQIKASPTCKQLGMALNGSNGGFEIYDFDNATGIVSNSLTIFSVPAAPIVYFPYGCEFSPDGTKFYGSTFWNDYFGIIHQWDVCAGSPTAIIASHYSISTLGIMGLQLAPDGEIYGAIYNPLAVIRNPNLSAAACSYITNGQALLTGTCAISLPGFLTSTNYVLQIPPPVPFTHTVSPLFGCQTASFNSMYTPLSPTVLGCATVGYTLTGMEWDFGDPNSGVANTSTLSNPSHAYSAIGSYTAQLILHYSCSRADDTLQQTINIQQSCLTVHSTSITCFSLGSATVTPNGSPGPFSYTWMPTAQTGSIASGLGPGIYTITAHDLSNNYTYTISTAFTPAIPLTGNLANSSSISCNGATTGTASITNISGGSGNQSYLWTNGTVSFSVPSPSNLAAGIWSLVVTDALTGCQINSLFFISQPPPVVVVPSVNTPSVCLGGSIILTGTASGGIPAISGPDYTYSWNGGYSGNTQTVINAVSGSYVYTLTAMDSLGCQGSQTIALNFVPYPALTVSDVSICPLQTGTLVANGATSYTWNTGATGATFTDVPAASQQYTVTGESFGCSSIASGNMILLPAPVPTLSSNSPVCQNNILTLSATGGTLFTWNGPNAFASPLPFISINPAGLSAGGIYSVIITAANTCTAAALQTVVINPLPSLTVSPASSSICANTNSVILGISGTATLFTWMPAQGILSNSTATAMAYPPSSQVYSLTGALNGCTTMVTATVMVVPPPLPMASLSSPSTCAEAFNGSPNTITLTASGAVAYTITTPNDIYNSNSSGPMTNLNTLPPHLPGISTATILGSNGVCTISTTAVFSIIPNPTVSVSNPTPVICAGQSYTYTSAGASSYTWSNSSPGQTLYTTGNIAVTNPSVNSVFSISGSSLGCNSALQSTSITVNPLPDVGVGPNPAIMCLNTAITLTANGNGTSYSWQPPYWLSSSQGTMVIANSPLQQNYTVTASLNSCTNSAIITVSVLPLPTLSVHSSVTDILCLNQSFTLSATGGIAYIWHYPNSIIETGPDIAVIPTDMLYAGSYTVTGTGTNGCQDTSTTTVNIENNPTGYLQGTSLQGCAPLCGNYRFVPANQQSIVSGWQINEQTFPAQNSFQKCFTAAGDYLVKTHLISMHGCINTVTFTINVYPQPKAEFTFAPEHPIENMDAVSFTPYLDSTNTQFNWAFINNDAKNQNTAVHPMYLFETAGTYPVVLVVRNQWNCTDSIVKTITVEPDFAVYIPNTFTPNEDDRNESFFPVTRGVLSLNFSVFDRWGEKIFFTNSLNAGWDGTFKGEPCKQDVYAWKLEAVSFDHQVKKSTGFVTLLR